MPTIGSVMPFPEPAAASAGQTLWDLWTGDKPAAAFGCARAGLAALLAPRGVNRVWAPAYACAALAEAFAGVETRWFNLSSDLEPDCDRLAAGVRSGDAVVAIDYFGRPPGIEFRALAASRPDVLWIEDCAQAADTGTKPWGDVVLFSPRKIIGVGDGAVLVGEGGLPAPFGAPPPPAGAQIARAVDPQGVSPQTWYPSFQAQEATFTTDHGRMSAETLAHLKTQPAAPIRAARRANARHLAASLQDLALWPRDPLDYAPLAFPIRIRKRDEVASRLAEAGIFCARHWAELPSPAADVPHLHRLAAAQLSLPCDQRYGRGDMDRIISAVRDIGVEPID